MTRSYFASMRYGIRSDVGVSYVPLSNQDARILNLNFCYGE